MARGLVPVVCVLLLLTPMLATIAQTLPASGGGTSIPIDLGFGVESLKTLDAGIPVYTQGDELWVMNTYNSTATLSLQGPQGGAPKATSSLASQSVGLLYTFPDPAPAGLWVLNSTWTAKVNASIPVEVALSTPGGSQGGLASATMTGSSLSLNYSLPAGLGDDVEAVLSDASLSGEAAMPIPATFGSGTLGVQFANDSSGVTVTLRGSVSTPFAFWVELYMDYSYSQIPTVGYTTSPVLAARSQAVQMASTFAIAQAGVERELVMRHGRYTVRAYFRSGSTISVEEAQMVLLDGGGWIWLNPASEQAVNGASFMVTADLAESPWPSYLVVTYRSGGVGSYAMFPLGVTPSTVSFTVPPWGVAAPDVSIALRPDPSVMGYGVNSGTLYVIGRTGSFHLVYDLALGNHTFLNSAIDIDAGLSTSVPVALGELIVNSTFDGKPASGATVTVSDGLGGSASHAAGIGGDAVFLLPPGSYNVTVAEGASRSSQTAEVTAAESRTVTASLSSSNLDLTLPLLGLAAFGAALNLWVWVLRPRRSVSRAHA